MTSTADARGSIPFLPMEAVMIDCYVEYRSCSSWLVTGQDRSRVLPGWHRHVVVAVER